MNIEAGRVKYYVFVKTENDTVLNLTNVVDELGWEQNERELSTRISFRMHDADYGKERLSALVKIGQLVVIRADWGGKATNVASGFIKESEVEGTGSNQTYKLTAYDVLFAMQKSQDSVYYEEGRTTKDILMDIFGTWGVHVKRYEGPNVSHSKLVFKSKTVADIILEVLDEAKKKGAPDSIVRSEDAQVSVLRKGSNEVIYKFTYDNIISASAKTSIVSMITRVKVMASSNDTDQQSVEAVVDGRTDFGIIQKITTHSQSDDLEEARQAAQEILDEHKEPEQTIRIQSPDVPLINKGDRVYVEAGNLDGFYLVKGVQHNAETGKMSMDLEYMPVKEEEDEEESSGASQVNVEWNRTYIVIAVDGLNMRAAPNGSLIVAIPYGCAVSSTGENQDGWLHVRWSGYEGWSYGGWLQEQ